LRSKNPCNLPARRSRISNTCARPIAPESVIDICDLPGGSSTFAPRKTSVVSARPPAGNTQCASSSANSRRRRVPSPLARQQPQKDRIVGERVRKRCAHLSHLIDPGPSHARRDTRHPQTPDPIVVPPLAGPLTPAQGSFRNASPTPCRARGRLEETRSLVTFRGHRPRRVACGDSARSA
jgi:hypothetical protein